MHALSHYENTIKDANQWFEEALCEAASMQALKDMAVAWQTNPPYPAWKSYASELEKYYLSLLNEEIRQLQQGVTLEEWYVNERDALRADAGMRDKNEVLGNKIFQFFDESPDRWRSLRYLNIGIAGGDISLE